jgi:hypothetical protein
LIKIASSVGEIIKASVNAPCTQEYCTFYKGKDAHLEFVFTLSKILKKQINWKKKHKFLYFFLTEKKAHKVRAKVVATIGTIDHDFALPNPDVCQQLVCPLKSGVHYKYHNSMFVSRTYPSVRLIKFFFLMISVDLI